MSKKSKQSTTEKSSSTSTTSISPELHSAVYGNLARTQDLANRPYQPYTGQRVAAPSAATTEAEGLLGAIASNQTGKAALDTAIGGVQGLVGFQPSKVNATSYEPTSAAAASINRGDVRNISGGLLSDIDLSKYTNPYEAAVIETTLADVNRQRETALNEARARAAGAKSFGGAGAALALGETERAFADTTARTAAQLRAQGYDRATGLANSDLERGFAAQKSNQDADLNVASTNAGYQQQSNIFNADSANTAGAFNAGQSQAAQIANQNADQAGAALRLSASGLLGDMSGQQLSQEAARAGLLGEVGAARDQREQARLDADYEAYGLAQNYPLLMQQLLNQSVGLLPQTGTTTTNATGQTDTTTKQSPGLGGIIKAIGTAAQTAAMFSDLRTKREVETVGYDDAGRRVVDFAYHWDRPGVRRRGYVAQELLQSDPHAVSVHGPTGFLMVDYSKVV